MRNSLPLLGIIALAGFGCAGPVDENNAASEENAATAIPALERMWVTSGFSSPEGVALAPDGRYFISNVVGDGSAADGEGFISIVTPNGEIADPRFVDGLNAPKGMAVMDGKLYVADIDTIRVRDALTGETIADIPLAGAKFLNDMTVWQGHVYVSDSGDAAIHRLDGETVTLWKKDEVLAGVNGLLGDGERLLVSTMTEGHLIEYTDEAAARVIASGMTDADGIGLAPGGYLVSAWRGEIYFVSKAGEVSSLLTTRDQGILQNDLTVFGNTVIVPNWKPGTVTAWQVTN